MSDAAALDRGRRDVLLGARDHAELRRAGRRADLAGAREAGAAQAEAPEDRPRTP